MSLKTTVENAVGNRPVRIEKDAIMNGQRGKIAHVTIEDVVLSVFVADANATSEGHFARIVASYVARALSV